MRIVRMLGICLGLSMIGAISVKGQENNRPAPSVVVSKVEVLDAAPVKRYVGTLEAYKSVAIVPRVTGTLLKVNFEEGSLVKEGDLLYEIEDTSYRATVDALKASIERQKASLRFAEAEFQRSKALLDKNVVTVASHDKAVCDIDAAKATLKELEASLINAENNLSYTKIYAPLTGRIGKNLYSEGNLLTPGMGKLTDIEMVAPIYARFAVAERIFRANFGGLEGVRENIQVQIVLADGTVYPEVATISLVDNKIDVTTNTVTLWATFENKDGRLLPGSFVTVQVSPRKATRTAAIVPSALIAEEDAYAVYVLGDGNQVEKRPVTLGNIVKGMQLVTAGLDGTETVLIDGTHKVTPGARVQPVELTSLQ